MNNADKPISPLKKPRLIGLTKREYFAGLLMQGMITGYDPESKVNGRFIPDRDYQDLAKHAVQCADALLKELEKE